MASDVDIANVALTRLGADRIMALSDNVKEAREINAVYVTRRNHLLRVFNWSFAMERVSLPALSTTPDWGYPYEYQLPSDCARVVQVNDVWQIPGLADYKGGPDSEPYRIEGRKIRTDIGAPLKLRYIRRVTNEGEFDDAFVEVFGLDLANVTCEAITQSSTKKRDIKDDLREAILQAIRANAIELPPQELPDDSWIISRL